MTRHGNGQRGARRLLCSERDGQNGRTRQPEPGGAAGLGGLIEITPLLRRRLDQMLLADSGLTGSDYPVLVALPERGGRTARSAELAELIGWEQSRLSHHLARMERRGLIRRSRHQADSRVAEVHLTEQGRDLFLAAAKGHSRAVRTHFADVLTVPQMELLAQIMGTLKQHLDSTADKP